MATANDILPHLTSAAKSLNKAFALARETGCDIASVIISRAQVLTGSAIEECIHPLDEDAVTAPLLRVVADDFTPSDDWREFPVTRGSSATFEIGGDS